MSKGTISAFFKPGPKPAEDAAPAVTPISAFFKPSPKPESNADSKPAATQAESAVAAAKGFELRFSRTSKVVEWDTGLFTDCRPSEADDAMDDTLRQAKREDHTEQDADCYPNPHPEPDPNPKLHRWPSNTYGLAPLW